MERFIAAFALAVLLAFARDASAQRDPCRQYTSCSSCASVATCGWCAGTRRCTSVGRGAQSCGPSWVTMPAACFGPAGPQPPPQNPPPSGGPDACAPYTDCSTCAQQGACGWCAASNRCMTGGSQGVPACSGGWTWLPNQCGGNPPPQNPPPGNSDACSPYTDCTSCAQQGACGWCAASNRCMTGGQEGVPACGGGWTWLPSQCGGNSPSQQPPPPPQGNADACSPYTDCTSCAQQSSCGWCAASNRCMTGGSQGAPACTGGWTWLPNQCSARPPPPPPSSNTSDACGQFATCDACASQQACGWCNGTQRCTAAANAGTCGREWVRERARCSTPVR